MTDSQNGDRQRHLQGGDPQRGDAPLAQEEGVNAASAEGTEEAGSRDVPGVLDGGDPGSAPDPNQGLTGYGATADDTELVGAPGDDPREPSEQHGSSGQDSGSMD